LEINTVIIFSSKNLREFGNFVYARAKRKNDTSERHLLQRGSIWGEVSPQKLPWEPPSGYLLRRRFANASLGDGNRHPQLVSPQRSGSFIRREVTLKSIRISILFVNSFTVFIRDTLH